MTVFTRPCNGKLLDERAHDGEWARRGWPVVVGSTGHGTASASPRSRRRVGQDRLREYFFFASRMILELQAVLGSSIKSTSTHHFQRCQKQAAEDWRGKESPKWTTVWRKAMTDGYRCHSTGAVCFDRGTEICHQN